MASPEPVPVASPRLRSAALADLERRRRDLARLNHRAEALARELAEIDTAREALRRHVVLLTRLAHDEDDSAFPPLRTVGDDAEETPTPVEQRLPASGIVLKGAEIRHLAVRLIASSAEPTRPIHHGEVYDLLLTSGYVIGGRDPHATLLTQLTRSPVLRRTGEPGFYALDLDAVPRLQKRLGALRGDLLASQAAKPETPDEIAAAREQREEVSTRVAQVERELEEALRSLGS